jgi:hypothetical protein
MIRIRPIVHAHFPGDPLCLGTEVACPDQTNPSTFKHTSDCISYRQALKLYHSIDDPHFKAEIKRLCVTFECIPSPLAGFNPSSYTTHEYPHAPPDIYTPYTKFANDDPLADPLSFPQSVYQAPFVSSCSCSLEAARRYRLTGTILSHPQLQTHLRRLISFTVFSTGMLSVDV